MQGHPMLMGLQNNIVKMTILPKESICSMQSPSKFQCYSSRDRKINPKVHIEAKKISNSQSNPEQKEQC
jgi:hypothetical protein